MTTPRRLGTPHLRFLLRERIAHEVRERLGLVGEKVPREIADAALTALNFDQASVGYIDDQHGAIRVLLLHLPE